MIIKRKDYMIVATKDEIKSLKYITRLEVLRAIATRYCDLNGYKLWHYVGDDSFEAHPL